MAYWAEYPTLERSRQRPPPHDLLRLRTDLPLAQGLIGWFSLGANRDTGTPRIDEIPALEHAYNLHLNQAPGGPRFQWAGSFPSGVVYHSEYGRGWTGAATHAPLTQSFDPRIGSGDFTMAALVKPTTSGGYKPVQSLATFSPGLYNHLSASGKWGLYWGADRPANTVLTLGQTYLLVATRRDGTIHYYLDGKFENSVVLGTAVGASLSWYPTSNGSGSGFVGDYWFTALWRRGMSQGEVWSLWEDPWQLFRQPMPVYMPTAAGGGPTVYERSFTLTGDGTVTVGAQAEFQSSITITGDGTYGGPAQWTGIGSATFTGDGVATFGTQAVFGAAVTVTGNAVVDFTGTTGTEFERSITLTGDGTAAFATQVDWSPQADFAGAGTVTVAGTGVFGATTTISGVASLAFTAGGTTNNAVGFTASGTVGFTENVGGVTPVSFTLTAGLGLIVVGQIVGSSPDGVWLVASPESDVWTKESPGAGWLD